MSTSSIQLPPNFNSDILTQATTLLSNFSGYITLIIGIILGVVIIEILIAAIKR